MKATPTNVVSNNGVTALGGSVVFTATVTGPTNGATPSGTVVFTVTGSAGVTACTSSSALLSRIGERGDGNLHHHRGNGGYLHRQ